MLIQCCRLKVLLHHHLSSTCGIVSPSFLVNNNSCTIEDYIILPNGFEVTLLVPLLKSDQYKNLLL